MMKVRKMRPVCNAAGRSLGVSKKLIGVMLALVPMAAFAAPPPERPAATSAAAGAAQVDRPAPSQATAIPVKGTHKPFDPWAILPCGGSKTRMNC